MVDAILSYHTSVATCGTAKFNQRLAKELGVPFRHWLDRRDAQHPLYSLKPDEFSLDAFAERLRGHYDLLLHSLPTPLRIADWMRSADRCYAANVTIGNAMRAFRWDTTDLWCPSTIQGNPTRGAINVLTFGMAHKIQTRHYETLKTLLDATGTDYTVSVSTAVHEGSPWDATAHVAERLDPIFGSRLRALGYLADDALAKELRDCTAAAIFYDPAFRQNNTSGWAVVDSGKPFITNRDEASPVVGLNISDMTEWPVDFWHETRTIGQAPTWGGLLAQLNAVHA